MQRFVSDGSRILRRPSDLAQIASFSIRLAGSTMNFLSGVAKLAAGRTGDEGLTHGSGQSLILRTIPAGCFASILPSERICEKLTLPIRDLERLMDGSFSLLYRITGRSAYGQ